MTGHPPVLVAGGGPVGLATALLLARWQIPVIVLEAKPAREPIGSKSICVQRDVLDIYHRIGVADALMEQGVTWHRGRTFYRDHELFSFTFPDPGRSAYPGFINIGQSSVERELEAAVRAEPLIDLRYGHTVVALDHDENQVTVRAQSPAGPLEVTGSHLVGADGPRSSVRSLLGLDFAGHSYDDLFLIADIRSDLGFGPERRFYFDPVWNPGRQVLVHPQPESVWRIDWQVPGDFDLAEQETSGGLDERIRRIVGRQPYEIVWLSLYRFHQRIASRLRMGRVLLAGDAAHLMSPFGARGLNSGIQDGENAAWKIAFARAGWAGPALLESYHGERSGAARENLRVTEETMRFLAPATESDWAHRRDVLERAVTDEAARAEVNSGKLAEPYWYLDSPLTTGTAPATFPDGPGQQRPPVAGVLCPDAPVRVGGRATRLRELIGLGITVLTYQWDLPRLDAATKLAPVRAYSFDEIDPDGIASAALAAHPGWCAVLRPDGHLAAVLDRPEPGRLVEAIHRACGRSEGMVGG